MADSKITALTAISTVDPTADPLVIVDVSDTSMAASGTTKKSTINQLLGSGGTATLASATITGDLTVDTSTLKVDSTNNRVGVNNASPTTDLDITGSTKISGTIAVGTGANAAVQKAAFLGGYTVFENSAGTGNPSITFNNDTDTGFFNAGANIIGFATGGSEQMRLNSTGLGVGATPTQKFVCAGPRAYFAGGGAVYGIGVGYNTTRTAADQVFFIGATDSASPDLVISNAAGSQVVRVDNSGNVGVGVTPTGDRRLEIKSAGTSNTSFAAHLRDSADTLLFYIRSDGYFNTGQGALSPYNNTSASAANVYIDSSGFLYRSTSSLKYKTDVKDSIHGLADVLKLRSVTYKSKNGDDTVFGGLIAEEVHAAGLTEFVAYAPDKTPDSINYGNMVALLASAIQELTTRVQTLEAK